MVFWEHGCTSSQKKTVGLDFFQRLAVFDYLLGNLDRHEENWLVKQDGGILAIDNTHTFIGDYVGTHFRDWPLRRFHYRWKHHPLATEPFKDKAKEKIKELTERKVEEFWRDLEHEFGRGNPLLEGKRKELFLERVKVLQKMGSEGGAPRQLGELFSKEAIHRYLFA